MTTTAIASRMGRTTKQTTVPPTIATKRNNVNTAIINPVQLPFWFLQKLEELELTCIEVHPDDPVSTVNCLAIAPGKVIMSAGISKTTLSRLDALGWSALELAALSNDPAALRALFDALRARNPFRI